MNWPNALVALFKLLPKKKATEIRDAVFAEFAAFRAERDRLREALRALDLPCRMVPSCAVAANERLCPECRARAALAGGNP
jgi:hypothetical protein